MKLNKLAVLIIVLSMLAVESQAQQLYKWVDAEGVTHYSETLPSQDIDHATLEFTEDYQVADSQGDYYSIQNQLKRLQERRAQQRAEKQQAVKQKLAKQPTPEVVYVQSNEPGHRYYLPAYHPRYNLHRYNKHDTRHYSKHQPQKSYLDKPRSGISQKAKVNHSRAVFSASR